jgi:RNA polymerase sigma-70 factor (ECF subfamily)
VTGKEAAADSASFAYVDREGRARADSTETAAEDGALMQRIARGDRRALEAFYARHGGLAVALARRMLGEREPAEDAVQDAFVSIWRRAGDFDAARCAARSWLLAIVRNRCIDELRRQATTTKRAAAYVEQPPALDDDPWPETWKRTCGIAIAHALAELPPEQREVVELGFYRGLSHAQIALATAAPLGTVKKRMRTGLKRLRTLLDDFYYESSPR